MPNLLEHQLIKNIIRKWQSDSSDVEIGMGDDGSVFSPSSSKLCWVQDMMIEGTHFLAAETSPFDLGHKALAVNLSDIAAMGARPLYFQISLALTPAINAKWVDEFYRGMMTLAQAFGVKLLGGDLSSSMQALMVDVSVIGATDVPIKRSPPQGTWNEGSLLWVAGDLGCAAAGREVLAQNKTAEFPLLALNYLRPYPLLKAAELLMPHANSISLIDVSDGLVSESEHFAEAAGRGILLNMDDFTPREDLALWCKTQNKALTDYLLFGGEDYALLAISPKDVNLPIPFRVLGEVIGEPPSVFVLKSGHRQSVTSEKGWNAFKV